VTIKRYLVILILFLGTVLRCHELDRTSLWYDEVSEVFVSSRTLPELYRYSRMSLMAVPMNYIITHGILKFGSSDFLVRLPAAVLGVLSIWLFYWLIRRHFDWLTALIGAYLLAISPVAIEYSREARNYSLLLFSTLLLISAWSWYFEKPGWTRIGVFIAVSVFSLYSHIFCGLVLMCMILVSIVHRPARDPRLISAMLFSFLCFVPWLLIGEMSITVPGANFLNIPDLDMRTLLEIAYPFAGNSRMGQYLMMLLFFAGLMSAEARRNHMIFWITGMGFICLGIVLWGVRVNHYFIASRQLIFLIPVFLVVVAYGIRSIREVILRRSRVISQLLIFSILTICFLYQWEYIRTVRSHVKQDWRSTVEYVLQSREPNDLVYASPYWWGYCVAHYWPENAEDRLIDQEHLHRIIDLPEESFSGSNLWWIQYHPYMPGLEAYRDEAGIRDLRFFTGGISAGRFELPIHDRRHLVQLIEYRLTQSMATTWLDPPQEKHVPVKEREMLEAVRNLKGLIPVSENQTL